VPSALAGLALRLLARETAGRPASAAALRDELAAVEADYRRAKDRPATDGQIDTWVAVSPVAGFPTLRLPTRARRAWTVALAVGLLLLTAGATALAVVLSRGRGE